MNVQRQLRELLVTETPEKIVWEPSVWANARKVKAEAGAERAERARRGRLAARYYRAKGES